MEGLCRPAEQRQARPGNVVRAHRPSVDRVPVDGRARGDDRTTRGHCFNVEHRGGIRHVRDALLQPQLWYGLRGPALHGVGFVLLGRARVGRYRRQRARDHKHGRVFLRPRLTDAARGVAVLVGVWWCATPTNREKVSRGSCSADPRERGVRTTRQGAGGDFRCRRGATDWFHFPSRSESHSFAQRQHRRHSGGRHRARSCRGRLVEFRGSA
mmetsp:Transcript_79336/g.220696  ORF Transcript_79336/g.220696 Transcript_79336/m.220696 type:complete len:212 (-) Transcript_79336:555-1190(-)